MKNERLERQGNEAERVEKENKDNGKDEETNWKRKRRNKS